MTAAATHTLRLGRKRYPVVLPRPSDPRLHLAAVIISIHVLGQTVLGFRVSVPQVLVAILTCALLEVVWTFHRTAQLVWPASAMLTGSGVALILREIGTGREDHWSWRGWYLFAAVAGISLLTKYVIRYRGSHLFNPSNVGLVAAFMVLGSARVEPLDFWWAPLDGWMAIAYAVILVGGILITIRLRLLEMAVAFWLVLAAGLGLLATSGHCITAAWALDPVCGSHFWQVVVTSPEILIFLFFMITDPKTIPRGRLARIAFAACLALVSTLLIAPQTTEFGAKVALLAGLVVMTPVRFFFEHLSQVAEPATVGLGALPARMTDGGNPRPLRVFSRGAMLGSSLTLVAVAIVGAGIPARDSVQPSLVVPSPEIAIQVDPSTIPAVTVDPAILALNSDIGSTGADALAMALAENLKIEGEAMLRADTSLLRAADEGERLVQMERRIEEAATLGELVVPEYTFDSLRLLVVFADGSQGGARLGLEARGVLEEIIFDARGVERERTKSPLASVFVLDQGAGDRWLIVGELPAS